MFVWSCMHNVMSSGASGASLLPLAPDEGTPADIGFGPMGSAKGQSWRKRRMVKATI